MKKKKILLILTGGTFGMKEGMPTNALRPSTVDGKYILEAVPEVKQLADVEWVSIFNLDSSDISCDHWENIGKTIQDNYSSYDGFVVIHGTDTMSYSATAVSFIMKETQKPVIFTGSQRPLPKIRTDARENFINAVEYATQDIPEVALSFGSELFRGNRARKTSIDNFRAFRSYNFPTLAKVGVNTELNPKVFRKKGDPKWTYGFDTRVLLLQIFPGMDADLLHDSLTDGKVRGVILQAFGAGNLPRFDRSWLSLVSDLTKKGIPTIITSQCNQGTVDLTAYENGQKAMECGAISCGDITTEACVVKLMFGLNHYKKYDDLIKFMQHDHCGEMN
ncbi:MAG: asparaginase [bacterium]